MPRLPVNPDALNPNEIQRRRHDKPTLLTQLARSSSNGGFPVPDDPASLRLTFRTASRSGMIVTGLADQAAAIIALRDGCGAVAIRCLNKVITGNLNCRLFHFQELQSIHESL
jgi:hypothetical protein